MFFYLSKLVWLVLTPTNFFILLILCGALLAFTRFMRLGRRMIWAGVALLIVGGFSPLSTMMMTPMEERFPMWREAAGNEPYGIIVIGGAIDGEVSGLRPGTLELTEAGDRITALIELARRYPQAKLVFSGGVGDLVGDVFGAHGVEADLVKAKIGAYGVDPARLVVENQSRTTWENAVMTRDVVRPEPGQRWLLVTSAWHMPRAVGCFRQAGFSVDAYPVDFRTAGWATFVRPFSEAARGLRRLDLIAKEWVGLVAYWMSGRSSALFPGPL
ncbi:YdcF family protein [Terrarubrum flagellatum]|uniref:YdcF family protein n=1 Tax=Terrirubrum flagellatum TaxID=2895980 RepID=UPI003145066E